MEINILLHGYSEGYNSKFMQYVSKELERMGKNVLGFGFRYIVDGIKPSENLLKEFNQLKEVIAECKSKGYDSINLIGKSLGGTISLHPDIIKDRCIKSITLLGFPLALGFPANISLLEDSSISPREVCIDTYRELFQKVVGYIQKITIIQGDTDWLGNKDELLSLFNNTPIKPNISFVNNASHGFKPITDTETFENNLEKVVDILKKKFL